MLTKPAKRLLTPADVPLEIVILWLAALAAVITGVLLIPAAQGVLPFSEDGLYGLTLFILALQTVLMGVTPFGDTARSPGLIAVGAMVAAAGIISCLVPDLLGDAPRFLLVACFGLGGVAQLLRGDRFRQWWRGGRELRRLALACLSVYSLFIAIALGLLLGFVVAAPVVAVTVFLAYGAALALLAQSLWAVDRMFPEQARSRAGDDKLSTDNTLTLLTGVYLLLLGGLLVPVNLGLLPFASSAQLGLLMVINAVGMLAVGSTPIGGFRRSRLVIGTGLLFAALGIVAILVPDTVAYPLAVLIALLNLAGGVSALLRAGSPIFGKDGEERTGRPPVLLILIFTAQVALGLLSVAFGISMLFPQLMPGLVSAAVLAADGAVLIGLLALLRRLRVTTR